MHTDKEAGATAQAGNGAFAPGKSSTGKGNGVAEAIGGSDSPQARRRPREKIPRSRGVRFGLTEADYADLTVAAQEAGLARAAYAAEAILAAARGEAFLPDMLLAEIVHELDRAATLVRRIATLLTQAGAKLNATGQPADDLPAYGADAMLRAARIEAVAEEAAAKLTKATRAPRSRRQITKPDPGDAPAGSAIR
jgi:hypothetical protein